MNRREAEDYVYQSYMKAEKYWRREDPDRMHRRPDLTRHLIRSLSETISEMDGDTFSEMDGDALSDRDGDALSESGEGTWPPSCPSSSPARSGKTPCIVVTGSKGKGSVAAMMAQILNVDFLTGLMTSPHLVNFCERFRVGPDQIPDEDFARLMTEVARMVDPVEKKLPKDVCISPMGIQTLLGLLFFRERRTQVNIFECGKGARYDDVNNVRHDYAVINRIFPEHLRELGGSLEKIAEDKSHVITGEEICAYTSRQDPAVMDILLERSLKLQVPLKRWGVDFWAENIRSDVDGTLFDAVIDGEMISNVHIPLLGAYQAENCALALAVCRDLCKRFHVPFSGNDFASRQDALNRLRRPGRMEILSSRPFVLLDACIHRESAGEVLSLVKALGIEKAVVIIGIPDDKDFAGTAEVMEPVASRIILTKSANTHYIFTRKQVDILQAKGIDCVWTDSLKEAITLAGFHDGKGESFEGAKSCQRRSDGSFPDISEGFEKGWTLAPDPVIILGTTSLIGEMEEKYSHRMT